jgi:N-formylglutamate amidohydrolase
MSLMDFSSQVNLFSEEIKDSFILHIPHSSVNIPDFDFFNLDLIQENLNEMTDWATDEIFDCDGIRKTITPFSRLFCDVERLDDKDEEMFKIGRGFYYTKDYLGRDLRVEDLTHKNMIYEEFYKKHHSNLKSQVDKVLNLYNQCYIVDCHSFNDVPIGSLNENPLSPDICLGYDDFHTPNYLLDFISLYLIKNGFSVEYNNPYSGCIIPLEYYKNNNNVMGVMIEVNKRLYMNGNVVDQNKVLKLKQIFNGLFQQIS